LIVDDEPLARRGVRARLEKRSDVEIVGECQNGLEAVRAIRATSPDLVFLDIQMPGLDGFGVVESVGTDTMPVVVFLTAYDEHALRAFDAEALDYLLKPIDDERFAQALTRAKKRIGGARAEPRVSRIAVRDRGRVVLVDAPDVDWVEADGDYLRLHVRGRVHLVRETMKAFEARLPRELFVRIHRSTIVNVMRVVELQPRPNGEFGVTLKDGTRLRLSRGFRDSAKSLLVTIPADAPGGC
jgi:two-component system, LytTR family, response regulator